MLEQPEFGRRLRQLRLQQGKSQVDLTGTGMSATYLSRLESGARPPTPRAIGYLAERLGLPVESFEQPPASDLGDVLATLLTLSGSERDAELRDMLQLALAEPGATDAQTRWQAQAHLARLHGALGDHADERTALDELRRLSDAMARPALQVHALIRLARCLRNLGEAAEARRLVWEALRLCEQHHLQVPAADITRSRLLLASTEAELGNLAEAARLSLEVCDALPRTKGAVAAESFWVAATAHTRLGRHDRAAELLAQALDALDSHEDLTLWMRLRLAATSLALQTDPPRVEEAAAYLDAVEPALGLVGSELHRHEFLFLRAQLHYQQGDLLTAEELCGRAEEGAALFGYRDRIRLRALRGLLDTRAGVPGALDRLRELAATVQQSAIPDLSAEIWRAVAEGSAPRT
ncbi:helix-turn-helix domain-containing protein [Streptomyces fulvoviolaceus]|uniref:helix-turn-helix domain-containing protein n=1 Tax=Streptomyces fulvoviolaceus TaxID=285535 RepID=UPI0021C03634|nr:helix-turn-helix transcriptional regulator [Streptomyces fulvoviolaceus]MCT9081055.1 helix-turn-helix domain-containing protein [Streptomyces fulvoviolaceus]